MSATAQYLPVGTGRHRLLRVGGLALLPVAVVVAGLLGTLLGPVSLPVSETLRIVASHVGVPVGQTWPATDASIVWSIRLPRVVTALLVGAALSLAGAIFQAVLRNPLADPFVIGTSSGAALGVAIAFVASANFAVLGFGGYQVFAFAGSALAVALVLLICGSSRRTSATTVLLAGFAVSTLMIAGMWLVAYEGGSSSNVVNWTMGSLASSQWEQLTVVGPLIVILAVGGLLFTRDLNAILLGEEQARFLGVSTGRANVMAIAAASLLTSLAVSIAGIIGFVGLVVPHVARLLYGPDHRFLLPATGLLGAAYLCLADLVARTLAPAGGELPLGVVTAVIGAPIFLFLLRRSGHAYRF